MLKYYIDTCLNSSDYIKEGSVDLFFCDPPYFISGNKVSNEDDTNSSERTDWDRQWKSKNEFYDWSLSWMKLMFKQLKITGSAYICISWEHSGKFQELLVSCGFNIKNRITWKRDKGRGAKTNWKSMHEDIWFVTKTNKYTFNIDDIMVEKDVIAPYRDEKGNPKGWDYNSEGKPTRLTYPGNLWTQFTVPFWSMKEVRSYAKTKKSFNNVLKKHNTQKPKDLVKTCIKASSNVGELVVDYFIGSGTTIIAAKELNRDVIGFDISPKCVEMLKTRLNNEV